MYNLVQPDACAHLDLPVVLVLERPDVAVPAFCNCTCASGYHLVDADDYALPHQYNLQQQRGYAYFHPVALAGDAVLVSGSYYNQQLF